MNSIPKWNKLRLSWWFSDPQTTLIISNTRRCRSTFLFTLYIYKRRPLPLLGSLCQQSFLNRRGRAMNQHTQTLLSSWAHQANKVEGNKLLTQILDTGYFIRNLNNNISLLNFDPYWLAQEAKPLLKQFWRALVWWVQKFAIRASRRWLAKHHQHMAPHACCCHHFLMIIMIPFKR